MTNGVESRQPTLAEVLDAFWRHRMSTVHVCAPGYVQTYDVATQTATIRLAIKQQVFNGNGTESTQEYPLLLDVPVAQPRSGAWFIHMPVSVGDSVIVHFADQALDFFQVNGGVRDPVYRRNHDLSDPIAVPANLTPDAARLAGLVNTHMMLGKTTGKQIHIKDATIGLGAETPADFVALASKVNSELLALRDLLVLWTPVPGDGGLALKALLLLFFSGAPSPVVTHPLPWPQQVASTVVRSQ